MLHDPDIRWRQRLESFNGAFAQLQKGAALARERDLSELEQQGLIQAFEFTHELAWNLLKDYLVAAGHVGLIGARDATREAFHRGLIEDGETWMEMIKDRNASTHTYDCELATRIARDILSRYERAFAELQKQFQAFASKEDG